MFAPNSFAVKNDKSSQMQGGIGPMLCQRLEEKRALKESTQFKITKLDTQLRKMLSAAASKSRRRETIEELDARMAQLEKHRVTSSLKLAEEKKILREIEVLEKTKKNEIEIQQIRNDLNTYRDIIHETNDVIIELESALVKVHLAERLGCSTTDLKEEIIACPASKMSRVIGKNGSNISQIERKTQVQIEVGDITSGEVGRIRIVGTEHGIVEAIKEIENVTLAIEEEMLVSSALSSYLAAKRYAVREALLLDNPAVNIDVDAASNKVRLRGRSENVAEAKKKILAIDCRKEIIMVAKKDTGFIVGKGGSTLSRLEMDHNVSINVESSDNAKEVSSVEIVGLTTDVIAACSDLKDIIHENEDVEDYILCTSSQKHFFLDSSGAVLKEIYSSISEQGRCLVVLDRRDDDSNSDGSKAMFKLSIKAPRSLIPIAKQLIQKRIEEYESQVITIHVDPVIIPTIIGKGGENIRTLEKSGAGATLDIDRAGSTISIQSSDLATRLAVHEKIKEIIENNQTEKVPIAKHIIGQLLGEPGKDVRKTISDEIGAKMSLDDDDNFIIIRGSKDKIAQAALLVEEFLNENFQLEFDVTAEIEQLLLAGNKILTAVEKDYNVRAYFNRSTSKVIVRGREKDAKAAMKAIETSLYGGEGYTVSRLPVPERFTGVIVGKNGCNLTKLEIDHGVTASLLRLRHELVLRGPPENVKICRANVIKMLATFNVSEVVPITRAQYEELSKDNTMKTLLDGISVSAALENTEVKLRGVETDVNEAKSRIVEKLTGKYVAMIPLDVVQLNKLQKTTMFSEKLREIGDSSKANLALDSKDCAINIEGKRSNVKKAKLTVFKYLEFMLPAQFSKVTFTKQDMKAVADAACLADVAAETGAFLWLDRDLSCIHIRAADAKTVEAALRLLGEKKEETNKLLHVIELEAHEAWIVPKILGKGGATINGIRKSSGCKIELLKDDLTITISGADNDRSKAKEILEEIITKARKECQFVVIPSPAMNQFIGKGGAHIKQVQEESNAVIDCERDRSALRISGTEEAVEKAVNIVTLWIAEWEDENSTKTLPVKESMLAAIVGKGGSVINLIQQETGCKINIDRTSSSVTVRGIARDVALQKIQKIIENETLEAEVRAAEKERRLKETQAAAEEERLRQVVEQAALQSQLATTEVDEQKEDCVSFRAAPVGMTINNISEDFLKPDPFVTQAGPDLLNFLMSDGPYNSEIVEALISEGLSEQHFGTYNNKSSINDDINGGLFFMSSGGVFVRI